MHFYSYHVSLSMTGGRFCCFLFFFKQKTAYEMRISDWSSDVCSSDLPILTHFDHKLGRYPYTGLTAGEQRPIAAGAVQQSAFNVENGRASCRERVCQYV